jgi:hypothetical protein
MNMKWMVAAGAAFSVTFQAAALDFNTNQNPSSAQAPSATQLNNATARAISEPLYNKNQVPRHEFDFNGVSAWLDQNGQWYVTGRLRHTRALCATYQLGIRFGHGTTGCLNVKWLTEPAYGPNVRQCNHAVSKHTGGGTQDKAAAVFDTVTCAQLQVRCEGQCD